MKALMVSIQDITTSTFREPFYAINEEDAKRSFNYIMNKNDIMRNHPSDFELYKVGMWDDTRGIYDMWKGEPAPCTPVRLFKGGEVYHELQIGGNTL